MPRSLNILALACTALYVSYAHGQDQRRAVLEFEIDLDTEPESRFSKVVEHFNASIQRFSQTYFAHNWPLRVMIDGLVKRRGPETDELQREIEGVARLTGIPTNLIHAVQLLYELQTLMVPIDNVTLPWRGPGCTGIVALNKADGMVYHARNLDFSPKTFMQDLTYTGIFKKEGKEVFRAQMIATYSSVVTGMKKGPNGFALETNTRFTDHHGGNSEMLKNLLTEKRPLNGWSVRKVMETAPDYEAAVESLSTVKMVATQFSIVSGVRKGTILARSPDAVVKQLVLGQPNYQCRDDYIIITNFDFYWHDVKEWFDPTSHSHSRRLSAQEMLNGTEVLTPEFLFSVIDSRGVKATDTMFQAIMNVESGLWNVSLPPLSQDTENQTVQLQLNELLQLEPIVV